MAFIRLSVFFGYIFIPSILINNKEKAKLGRQVLEEQGKEEFYSEEGMVTNKTLDSKGMKLPSSWYVQLTMLLFSLTNYTVTAGLQDVFQV